MVGPGSLGNKNMYQEMNQVGVPANVDFNKPKKKDNRNVKI